LLLCGQADVEPRPRSAAGLVRREPSPAGEQESGSRTVEAGGGLTATCEPALPPSARDGSLSVPCLNPRYLRTIRGTPARCLAGRKSVVLQAFCGPVTDPSTACHATEIDRLAVRERKPAARTATAACRRGPKRWRETSGGSSARVSAPQSGQRRRPRRCRVRAPGQRRTKPRAGLRPALWPVRRPDRQAEGPRLPGRGSAS